MRSLAFSLLAALILAACTSTDAPPAPTLDVEEAAASEPPLIRGHATGKDGYVYHNVSGACGWLQHGVGRNNAWGLARLPLGQIEPGEVVTDEFGAFEVHYTCTDGSACIQSGSLEDTPDRKTEHRIPFGSKEHASTWLAEVSVLEAACAASR